STEVEDDAVLLVDLADHVAQLRADDSLERSRLGAHDVDLHLAGAERRGHLETDEARAEHHGPTALACGGHDPSAVGPGAERVGARVGREGPRGAPASISAPSRTGVAPVASSTAP